MSSPAWNRRRRNTRRAAAWRAWPKGRGPAAKLERDLNALSPAGGVGGHYDTQGRPCGMGTWAVLLEYGGQGTRTVAQTRTAGGCVSTVWLGIDHGWGLGDPVLWETMTFGVPGWADYQARYTSREQALAGHNAVVDSVRSGVVYDDLLDVS